MRYQLVVGADRSMTLFDRKRRRMLAQWSHATVVQLARSGLLPQHYCREGVHSCERCFASHMLVAGHVVRCSMEEGIDKVGAVA